MRRNKVMDKREIFEWSFLTLSSGESFRLCAPNTLDTIISHINAISHISTALSSLHSL